jgi:hypothetical protein
MTKKTQINSVFFRCKLFTYKSKGKSIKNSLVFYKFKVSFRGNFNEIFIET